MDCSPSKLAQQITMLREMAIAPFCSNHGSTRDGTISVVKRRTAIRVSMMSAIILGG